MKKFARVLAITALALLASFSPVFVAALVAQTANFGASSALNLTAGTTQVSVGRGMLGCVEVITLASAVTTISDIASGSPGATTAILVIPASEVAGAVTRCVNWPVVNGIAITVGTSGVVAVSFGRQ
jgi:hypothetical protein